MICADNRQARQSLCIDIVQSATVAARWVVAVLTSAPSASAMGRISHPSADAASFAVDLSTFMTSIFTHC